MASPIYTASGAAGSNNQGRGAFRRIHMDDMNLLQLSKADKPLVLQSHVMVEGLGILYVRYKSVRRLYQEAYVHYKNQ